MKRLQSLFVALVTLLVLCVAGSAQAVTCTLTGSVRIEPMDNYYCKTSILGCAGWKEVNLDQKLGSSAAPMSYMFLRVREGSTNVGFATTNASGDFTSTLTFASGSCSTHTVTIRYYFDRIHEADIALAAPRERFAITDIINEGTNNAQPGTTVRTHTSAPFTLTGTTTVAPLMRFENDNLLNPSSSVRFANVYYTLNSAMTEVITWSKNLNTGFDEPSGTMPMRLGYESTWGGTGGTTAGPWGFLVGYDAFAMGSVIRHEFGHLVHAQMHHLQRSSMCETYNFNEPPLPNPGNAARHCEYGSKAMSEGLTQFIGVRSIVDSTGDAFICTCFDPLNQDRCSELAFVPDSDGDKMMGCNGSFDGVGWVGISDNFSNDNSDCIRLRKDNSCNCTGSPCEPTFWQQNGWRNSDQVARFLWDMIDAGSDGGQDDTSLTIQDLTATIEGMPCSAGNIGVDGSCHEQARTNPANCNPAMDGATSPNGTGTRDSFNVYDFAEMIVGDQAAERTLNCAQGALD